MLAAHPRRAFSRAQQLARVRQSSSSGQGEATVSEHVHRLRQQLEADRAHPTLLRMCRGAAAVVRRAGSASPGAAG